MALGTAAAIGIGLGTSALGGIAGAMGKNTESQSWIDAGKASGLETRAGQAQSDAFSGLQKLANAGPGESDVTAATGAQRSLAQMLSDYSKTGGMPSASDISTAGGFADSIFAPQYTQLEQAFRGQTTDTERLAARLGRPVNDPILQAKLRTGYMDNVAGIGANKGSYAAQLALGMPGRRVEFAGQAASTLSNLASQAFQNRAAILAEGSNLVNSERQWRLNTGTKYGKESGGGGLGGAISGGLAGLGTGLSAASMFSGGFNWSGMKGSPAPMQLDFSQPLTPQIQATGELMSPATQFGVSGPSAYSPSANLYGTGGGYSKYSLF